VGEIKVQYAFQEVVDEVSKLKDLEEAIALAAEREKEARAFYQEKAANTEDIGLKDLYTYLADEEAEHFRYLEEYREKKKLPEIETELPSGQSFTPEFVESETRLGAIGVVIAAMRHERKSEYFYMELAKKSEEESQKQFFEILAGYESIHYDLLDSYLESITEFRMQT
jgi:rubrerythrin